MTNDLNERRSNTLIVVALVCSLVFAVAGLIAGLAAGLNRKHRESAVQPEISHFLLVDAADGLRHSSSALRLCNEDETALATAKRALVYVVRAETALECEGGVWCDCMPSESFLNDAAAVLSSADAKNAVEIADRLYALSCEFYDHVTNGAPFEYDGELSDKRSTDGNGAQLDAASEEQAKQTVDEALGFAQLDAVGSYGDTTEFASADGYAAVKGGKIIEYAFSSGGIDVGDIDAQSAAEEVAAKCGFKDLSVYSVAESDGMTTVKLCDKQGGAYCRDDCATVVIVGSKARAFSAGHCTNKHDVPKAKVDEITARKAAPQNFESGLSGEGRLVTTFDGTRDRVCYEYRYELDDGEHFVYVCAENGKQMQVR